MTELPPIPASDLEQLSAYLDGQLQSPDSAELEARLRREPQLRQALEELQATVQMLGGLPTAVLPRDFRLTEQMLPQPSTVKRMLGIGGICAPRPYPVMQLGTALAGLALVVVVGADLLLHQSVAGFDLRSESAPASQFQPIGQISGQAEDELQPLLQLESPSEQDSEVETQSSASAEVADRAAAPAEEQAGAQDGAGTPAAEFAAPSGETREPTGTQSAAVETGAELAAGAATAEGAQVGEELTPELSLTQGVDLSSNPSDQFRSPGRLALTVLEVGLAAITLMLLILSVYFRRPI